MKRLLLALLLFAVPLVAQTPTPTPTGTPTPTRTPTPAGTPTPVPIVPSRYSLAAQVRPGFGTFSTEGIVNKFGDTYYAVDSRTFGRVAGNTTTTRKFWLQAGTGIVSAAPVWAALISGDIPNNAANTTGSAAKWTTARLLAGNSVDGSANVPFANAFVVGGTTDAVLSGAQFLGVLDTGIVKNTTTTGILSIAAASDLPSVLTTKGDLATFSTIPARLGVGDDGFLLIADSTQATGLKWQAGGIGGTVDGIATVTLVAGTGITISDNTPGAGDITITSSGGGGGGGGGSWIMADPNFSTGTSYERVSNANGLGAGLLQLKPTRVFSVTHADSLANPPESWTWDGTTANLTSADENTTTANALRMTHNTSSTDNFWDADRSAPRIYRSEGPSVGATDLIWRMAAQYTQTGITATGAIELYAPTSSTWCEVAYAYVSGTDGALTFYYAPTNAGASATVTTTNAANGLWVRLIRNNLDCMAYYSVANQATPPTAWTFLDRQTGLTPSSGDDIRTHFSLHRWAATCSANCTADFMYVDSAFIAAPWDAYGYPLAAAGFDDSGPAVTLVASADLSGAGAAIADADVRSAVTEIENQRFFDSGTWTYSAVRGSSPSPAASTYQAKASITVGGSGQYFALYAKCTSTSRIQPCSLNAAALRIPFTP